MGLIQHAENAKERDADPHNADNHPRSRGRCHGEPDHRKQPSENCQQHSDEFHIVFLFVFDLNGFDFVKAGGGDKQQTRADDGKHDTDATSAVQTRDEGCKAD